MATIRARKDAISTHVCRVLKDTRKEQGLSLRQLADVLGINYSHIHRIEKGTRGLTLDVLDDWGEALTLPRWRLRAELLLNDLSPDEVRELFRYWQKRKA
jgi:transcriptional regulator with XRE-family HTH domain